LEAERKLIFSKGSLVILVVMVSHFVSRYGYHPGPKSVWPVQTLYFLDHNQQYFLHNLTCQIIIAGHPAQISPESFPDYSRKLFQALSVTFLAM
jgi:hypothetical protein